MKLAEAKKGEMNATPQLNKLGAAIESSMVRAEADALIAASKHKECVLVARALREGRQFFLCVVLSEGLLTHLCCILHSSDPQTMGVETGEGPTSRSQETSTQLKRRSRRRRRRVDEPGQTLPLLLFMWSGRQIEQDASRKKKKRSKGCGKMVRDD